MRLPLLAALVLVCLAGAVLALGGVTVLTIAVGVVAVAAAASLVVMARAFRARPSAAAYVEQERVFY